MEDITSWFTLENLRTLAGAAVAVRIVVEYTKDLFDAIWTYAMGRRPLTFLYALTWSLFVVYGIGIGGDWRVNVFNAVLLAVVSGLMQKPTKPPQQG